MALYSTVTGHVAEPQPRYTQKGQTVLELRINGTTGEKNRDTGEWSDVGEQLWVSATFWDDEAERLAAVVNKGDRVTVQGPLVLEKYEKRDGGEGLSYVIRYPRFLGVIPKRGQQAPQPQAPQQQASFGQPAGGTQNDPWTQPNTEAPF